MSASGNISQKFQLTHEMPSNLTSTGHPVPHHTNLTNTPYPNMSYSAQAFLLHNKNKIQLSHFYSYFM